MTPKPVLTEDDVRSAEGMLQALALRAVRDAAIARDLVQETFLAAVENRARFAGRAPLRGWMVGILDRRTALRVLDAAMATLPELERLAILLCDVEQLDRREVVETLGVTSGHLRVLLHRGRHKLRKALEDARMR